MVRERSTVQSCPAAPGHPSRNLATPPATAQSRRGAIADMHHRPRGADASELCGNIALFDSEGAGKAGRWPRPWPACRKKCRRQVPQVWPNTPGPPCAMGLRLIRALPGDRLCCPHRPRWCSRISTAGLTSASGGQDHTTSRPHRDCSSALAKATLQPDTSTASPPRVS